MPLRCILEQAKQHSRVLSNQNSAIYYIILYVNAVVLLDLGHDEGALDGADVLDIA